MAACRGAFKCPWKQSTRKQLWRARLACLAPLPAAPDSSRTATSASWEEQHKEEGRKAQPIAARFARHTCTQHSERGRLRRSEGEGGTASRKATRQFSKANRWTGRDFSSSSGSEPPRFEPDCGTEGWVLACRVLPVQGVGVPRGRELGKGLMGRISSRDVRQIEQFGVFPTTHQDSAATAARGLLGSPNPPKTM